MSEPTKSPDIGVADRRKVVGDTMSAFREAVVDAKWVVVHVARRGIDLSSEDVTTLTNAANVTENSADFRDFEPKFWAALKRATEKIPPASIESIRYIYAPAQKPPITQRWRGRYAPISAAQGMIDDYRAFAWLAIAILVICQLYWSIGHSAYTEVNRLDREIFELRYSEKYRLVSGADKSALDESKKALRNEFDEKIVNLGSRAEANYAILNFWYFLAKFDIRGKDAQKDRITLAAGWDTILKAFSAYFFPLIYGWLGALAYSLRNIELEIRAYTLRRISRISMGLRQTLGAISGLAIGWVTTTPGLAKGTTGASTSSATGEQIVQIVGADVPGIGAFALAFVVGYSVELLFAALDKIVQAFGGRPEANK